MATKRSKTRTPAEIASLTSEDADVYLRISHDPEDDELGVDRQRTRTTQLREARAWPLGVVHVDNDRSASDHTKPRPGFEALMARVEAGKVKRIVAWHLDRLLRNRYDQLRLFEAAEKFEMVISLVEGSDIDMSTAAGQLVADILASQARSEIKLKSKRQSEAQFQAAEQGRRVGGRKPFGYKADGVTLITVEAQAIRQACDDILVGISLGAIARRWNTAGLLSGRTHSVDGKQGRKKGEPITWNRDTVKFVLTNPRNIGIRCYRGEEIGPAVWPAIPGLEEPTFRAVVRTLNEPARLAVGSGNVRDGQKLLTGLALCGVCGSTVNSDVVGRTGRSYAAYRCSQSRGHISRKADPIEQYVSDLAIARLARPDAAELLIDREKADVEALRLRAVALRKRLEGIAAEFEADEDGDITPQQFRIISRGLQAKLADVQDAMADAARVEVLGPLINADDIEAMWHSPDFTTERQRAVINNLMTVTILPAGKGYRIFSGESLQINPK